jgi:hypothetical protein
VRNFRGVKNNALFYYRLNICVWMPICIMHAVLSLVESCNYFHSYSMYKRLNIHVMRDTSHVVTPIPLNDCSIYNSTFITTKLNLMTLKYKSL